MSAGRVNQWQKTAETIASWREQAGKAAAPFESRWTELALRRTDADLARRLHEQRNLFHAGCLKGDVREVELQGAALVRGYAAAVKRMEDAGAEDDAYMLGADPASGIKVAIGEQKAAIQRVRKLHGQDVVWLTPDEVAVLMASAEALKGIAAIKNKFPGAEMVRRYAEEGCSEH